MTHDCVPQIHDVLGFKMLLSPKDRLQNRLIDHGIHEWAESALLPTFVRRGTTAIDIGANVGYYSLLLSRLVGPQGHVYAFEPLDIVYQTLVINIGLNADNITPAQLAVSDQNEVQRYNLATIETEGETNLGGWSMARSEADDNEGFQVESVKLDDFLETRPVENLGFMKMDIEGHESRALHGALGTIEAFRPVMMIEFLAQDEAGHTNVAEIVRLLTHVRYTICRIHKKPWPHIRKLTEQDLDADVHFNAICYRGQHDIHP